MKFSDVSIKARLIGGFAVVALITVAVGLFSIVNMTNIADRQIEIGNLTTDFAYDPALITRNAISLRETMLRYGLNMLLEQQQNYDAFIKTIQDIRANTMALMETIGNLPISADSKTILESIDVKRRAFVAAQNAWLVLVEDPNVTGLDMFQREYYDLMSTADAFVTAFTPLTESLNKDVAGQVAAANLYQSEVMLIVMIVLVIAIVLAITIGLVISTSITRPIAAVTAKLKEIAQGEGDLTQTISIKAKDETGQLAHYFNETLEKIKNLVIII
jgi:methyl-accepting chemotaxis protein